MTELTLFNRPLGGFRAQPLFGWPLLPRAIRKDDAPEIGDCVCAPAVDVRDAGSEFLIEVDLPGVPKDAATVEFHDGRLTVEAKRAPGAAPAAVRWTRRERAAATFRRSFRIPETVDASRIRAESKDGVLTVSLPKLEKAQPRRIEVSVH